MYYTGFADESAVDLAGQIAATKALGWHCIESRCIDKVNIHDLPESEFEKACELLAENDISVDCFGSAVANWACDPFSEADFQHSCEQLARAIKRMKTLNCRKIRAMSFKAQWERAAFDPEVEKQVFPKVEYLAKMCEDAGVLYLHENCNNYGGQSWKHTLKLLGNVKSSALRLIFDTGNPVMNYDRSCGDELTVRQDPWEFYRNVRDFVEHVHIKDGFCDAPGVGCGQHYTFPGEGNGCVVEIVRDLLKRGYDGGFSMEPHMVTVFHAKNADADPRAGFDNYVEYGRRFMKIVDSVRAESAEK